MKRDPVILIVVAMLVSVLLVFGFHVTRKSNGQTSTTNDMKGKAAPDFALQSLDGKTIHLSDYRGKAVLLNFWATWCEPCKIEMPWFVELQKQYGPEGLQIVGIAADEGDSKDSVSEFAEHMGVNYPILLGKEAVSDTYGGVQFLPATFYIGRNGKIVDKVFGLKGKGEIEDDVKKALAEGQVQASTGAQVQKSN